MTITTKKLASTALKVVGIGGIALVVPSMLGMFEGNTSPQTASELQALVVMLASAAALKASYALDKVVPSPSFVENATNSPTNR